MSADTPEVLILITPEAVRHIDEALRVAAAVLRNPRASKEARNSAIDYCEAGAVWLKQHTATFNKRPKK